MGECGLVQIQCDEGLLTVQYIFINCLHLFVSLARKWGINQIKSTKKTNKTNTVSQYRYRISEKFQNFTIGAFLVISNKLFKCTIFKCISFKGIIYKYSYIQVYEMRHFTTYANCNKIISEHLL